jgi:hypothetical protein
MLARVCRLIRMASAPSDVRTVPKNECVVLAAFIEHGWGWHQALQNNKDEG